MILMLKIVIRGCKSLLRIKVEHFYGFWKQLKIFVHFTLHPWGYILRCWIPKLISSYIEILTEPFSSFQLHFRSNRTEIQKGVGENRKVWWGVCRVSRPISLKPKKSRSTMRWTVWESVKGKYDKNHLEPYGLKTKNGLIIFPFFPQFRGVTGWIF